MYAKLVIPVYEALSCHGCTLESMTGNSITVIANCHYEAKISFNKSTVNNIMLYDILY